VLNSSKQNVIPVHMHHKTIPVISTSQSNLKMTLKVNSDMV